MKKTDLYLRISAFLIEIDKYLAISGLIVATLIFFHIGLRGSIVGIWVSVLLIISCLLWLSMRRQIVQKQRFKYFKGIFYSWAIFSFLFYILSILCIYFRQDLYERPFLYFLFSSLMVGTITCQILMIYKRHVALILLQIILLGMSLTWTQLIITPGLVGIDPWFHQYWTNMIIELQALPSPQYIQQQPFFHTCVAITSILTSLPYKYSTIVSICFCMIFCFTSYLFIICVQILKNYRIGLLASLCVIIAPLVILRTYWTIPNSFGPVFIVMLVFLIYKDYWEKKYLPYTLLIILIMLALILVHPIPSISFLLILFMIIVIHTILNKLYHEQINSMPLSMVIIYALIFLGWWVYKTMWLNQMGLFFRYGSIIGEFDRSVLLTPTNVRLLEDFYSMAGNYLFLVFSFIGIFYMLSKHGNNRTISYAVISIIPLLLSFITFITDSFFLIDRWIYISQILMSVPLAVSIYITGNNFFKKRYAQDLFIIVFLISLSFLTISSPSGSNDFNPFDIMTKTPDYYTQSELDASVFIANYNSKNIFSDTQYSAAVLHYIRGIPQNDINNLTTQIRSGVYKHDKSLKIFRENYIDQMFQKDVISLKDININQISEQGFNKVYVNSGIVGFVG